MPDAPRLLIWTENYWVGGCDRFLADLLCELRTTPVTAALAGNPHPGFDAWLQQRVPWLGPRTVIPIANLVRTPLHGLDRFRPRAPLPGLDAAQPLARATASEPVAVRASIAGARYAQAGLNLARLRRLFARAAPDALLINNGGYPGGESCRVAAVAAREAGVPRIIEFVHNMAQPPAWPAGLERALDRHVDAGVDRWATAAARASDELSAQRGFDRARIATVHYGLPRRPSPPPPDRALRAALGFADGEPGLAVVANLEPRKGLGVLVGAIAHLRSAGRPLRTVIVGEGPERNRLLAQIAELELGESVRLLGWRDDVDAILSQATLLALPSLADECLPYVILEAMEHGLPVVGTDVAGIPEMVADGETGRVVAPGEVAELAGALAELTADPGRAETMGRRGRERQQAAFGADRMAREMTDLLGLA